MQKQTKRKRTGTKTAKTTVRSRRTKTAETAKKNGISKTVKSANPYASRFLTAFDLQIFADDVQSI